jgi:MutS domain V
MSLEKINDVFKLPIFYLENVKKLNKQVVDDLELTNVNEANMDDAEPIYHKIFKPDNEASIQIIKQLSNYYTTDKTFLTDTQKIIQSFDVNEINTITNKHGINVNDTISAFKEIKGETAFCEKYLYIDWSFAKELNNSPQFLQIMSIYNIMSPIISLCLPIIVLIIPFIVVKIKGIELTISEYFNILKMLISNHSIYKIFTQFNEVDGSQKMYLIASAAFYLFSIYQNLLVCIRFYSNIQKVYNYLFNFKKYVAYIIDIETYFLNKTHNSYDIFNKTCRQNMYELEKLYWSIQVEPTFSIYNIKDIGHVMSTFYKIYCNPEINDLFLYSFGFYGYFNLLVNTAHNVSNKKMKPTKFCKKSKKGRNILKMRKMYYPNFINDELTNIVVNDCDLKKNMIITGPNASGKTTLIKSVLINVILSQQIGFGCFHSFSLTPYDSLNCYLNIPDTSGRDSLFQAEARRCKEILENVKANDLSHFCVFDELYSGTNPDEAIVSANAFMEYLVKNANISCILTTHFIELCKKLSKNKMIENYNMKTIEGVNDSNFVYTYKLIGGISDIKGGIQVLKDLNYPKEILELTNKNR